MSDFMSEHFIVIPVGFPAARRQEAARDAMSDADYSALLALAIKEEDPS